MPIYEILSVLNFKFCNKSFGFGLDSFVLIKQSEYDFRGDKVKSCLQMWIKVFVQNGLPVKENEYSK